jgi:DNA mismatch endonuclease (patch repair protein)
MMAGIRGKDTAPELLIRRALFARGLRYKLHDKTLPGKPDLVFPRFHAALFVHGCFWHAHDCSLFRLPGTRTEWWREKLERNQANDTRHMAALLESGWRVATVWECALRKRDRIDSIADQLAEFVRGQATVLEIRG